MPSTLGRAAWVVGLSVILLTGGCGDDGDTPTTDAYTYQGFWIMTSWTQDVGAGPEVLERGGTPRGLLGDASLTATSATEANLSVRFALVEDEALGAAPGINDATVEVEGSRWVLHNGNDPLDPADDTVAVYDVTYLDGDLTLTVNPSDPRHDETDGPSEIVLRRHTPWSKLASGEWQVTALDVGTGLVDPRLCVMAGPGQRERTTIDITIDERWLFHQTTTSLTYGDMACATTPTEVSSELIGYVEEEVTSLRLWLYDSASATGVGSVTFSLTPAVDARLLVQTACGPLAFCTDGAPLEVHLSPAP